MLRVLFFFFFLSGFSGLVFEVVWMRQLSLIFGSSSHAVATVTAAFLGGLGLGSLLAGRLVSRLKRPLAWYGVLEALVAVSALMMPWAFQMLQDAQFRLLGGALLSQGVYSSIRIALVSGALLIPTMSMGMTLPILVHGITDQSKTMGQNIGTLYGLNTLGAFLGVVCAGFLFLPILGMETTTRLAASLNGLIALCVLLIEFLLGWKERSGDRAAEDFFSQQAQESVPTFLLLNFLFFSGFVGMIVQVGFTRLTGLILGSSVYSFSTILAVMLAGMALGSLLYGRWLSRYVSRYRILGGAQLVLALSLLAAVLWADHLPAFLRWFAQMDIEQPFVFFPFQAMLLGSVVLIPSIAMGVGTPLAFRLLSGSVHQVGKSVGRGYFVNTVGLIHGAFIGSFTLIPGLGLQKTLIVCVVISTLLGLILFHIDQGLFQRRLFLRRAPWIVGVLLVVHTLPPWNMASLTSGYFRQHVARAQGLDDQGRPSVLFHRDGPSATVTVERLGDTLSMKSNGKAEASNRYDMPTQILVGLLPMLLHEKTENQMTGVVGYGSGITVGAMLQAKPKTVVTVELEPAIITASSFFDTINHNPLDDPRVVLKEGDARTVLGYSPLKFDVLVSEPSNPWVSGASSLFTLENYQLLASRLKDKGLFAQWIQLYEISPESLRAILRTFRSVFPYGQLFTSFERSHDLILVGSKQPVTLAMKHLEARMTDPAIRDELKRAGVGDASDLAALLQVPNDYLDDFIGEGTLNTDDNGLVEFRAPLDMLQIRDQEKNVLAFHYGEEKGSVLSALSDLGDTTEERGLRLGRLSFQLLARGRGDQAQEVAKASLEESPTRLAKEVLEVSGLLYLEPEEWPSVDLSWLMDNENQDPRYAELATAMTQGVQEETLKLSGRLYQETQDARFSLIRGWLLVALMRFPEAIRELKPLAENDTFASQYPIVDFFAGRALDRGLQFQQSLRYLARFNEWRKTQDIRFSFELTKEELKDVDRIVEEVLKEQQRIQEEGQTTDGEAPAQAPVPSPEQPPVQPTP